MISAYLDQAFQLDMSAVPYKGEAPMVQDMIGGQIPMAISTLGTAAPFIASGKLRPLAVLADHRLPELPNVPTMAEAGFPGREYIGIGGLQLLAPAGTPAPVLARLEKEARAAIQSPAMKARFQIYGLVGIGNSSQDFRRSFEETQPVIAKLVKASGAKVE
jgi:tripartite-type tricarboxylate transporter receptor subunit TctC